MKRKSIQVTVIFFLSTLVQVLSNIILTRLFGTSIEYSHFLAAVTLPTIFVSVIYGTLNDALMPLYGEQIEKDKQNSERFFFEQLTSITILSFIFTFVLNLLSPFIMGSLFGSSTLSQSLLIRMFSILNFAIPFSTFVTILGMRFYIKKNYTRFPTAQLVGSVVNLLLVIALIKTLGAWGIVLAFVANIFVQILFVLPGQFKFYLGNISQTLFLWLPLIIGITALKSDGIIIRTFSSQLPSGFIVYHNLISKVASLSAGLITIGIQVMFLPNIIEKLARKEYSKTRDLVAMVKLVAIALSLLLVALVYFLSPYFIKILFVGGRFTMNDFDETVKLIPYYLLPVFGWGIVNIFLQPLYAIKKHLYVGLTNLFCLLVAWCVATSMNNISPSLAISVGLSTLLLGSVLGSEFIWQYNIKKLSHNK